MGTDTVMILLGLAVNFIAIIAFFNRTENRLTKVETLVEILIERSGIKVRSGDMPLLRPERHD